MQNVPSTYVAVSTIVRLGISIIHLVPVSFISQIRIRIHILCRIFSRAQKKRSLKNLLERLSSRVCAAWDKPLCCVHYPFEQDVPSERETSFIMEFVRVLVRFFLLSLFSECIVVCTPIHAHSHSHRAVCISYANKLLGGGWRARNSTRFRHLIIYLVQLRRFFRNCARHTSGGRTESRYLSTKLENVKENNILSKRHTTRHPHVGQEGMNRLYCKQSMDGWWMCVCVSHWSRDSMARWSASVSCGFVTKTDDDVMAHNRLATE